MNRRPVHSTNVASVGFEPSADDPSVGTMQVEFHSGHIYEYDEVPVSVYHEFIAASSAGRYLNQFVSGEYGERRVS